MDLFDEMNAESEDKEILEKMKARKKKKSFDEVINKKKLDKFELDEALNEAET
jgi:hypothetical protein